jgi:pyruvate formate lyase activating enzyme
MNEKKAVCSICPHNCALEAGETSICGARRNIGGELIAEAYGRITSAALDPIEKKPLYHFYPGSKILSLGSYGCNFNCGFCQNASISVDYKNKKTLYNLFTPTEVAASSLNQAGNGNIGVAYTYNEPLINYEYIYDCAKLIAEQNQKNVLVTNGYINKEPLENLLPYISAMNIDIKSFDQKFYDEIGGSLDIVLKTAERAARSCHVEITTLVIPGKNDSPEEMRELTRWLAGISKDIPLHISRFFPRHKYTDIPATPVGTIKNLVNEAKQNLNYVYAGNC